MLLILSLLAFFPEKFNAQRELERITRRANSTLIKLNLDINAGLRWCELLAEQAYNESRKPGTQRADLKVTGRYDFKNASKLTLKEMVNKTLQEPLERKRKNITALPNGTYFGCDGFFNRTGLDRNRMTVTCLYIEEPQDKTPLPADMKSVFENLTALYKENLTWKDELAGKALEESEEALSVKTDVKVKAKKSFRKRGKTLAEKLLDTMKKRFEKKGEDIGGLQEGAQYGCNGTFSTDDKYMNITATCLYCNPRSHTRNCFTLWWNAEKVGNVV